MKHILKRTLKRVLKFFGLEIYKSGGRRRSMKDLVSFISEKGFEPQTVIDVGVAYGTPELYETFPKATHLLVEPLKEYEKVLKDISQRYNAQYVIAAAGSKKGKTIINVHADLSSSSVYHESDGSYADGIPREVFVVTLDDLCKERNLKGPYLIKIDTQGAEFEVLNGAKQVLKNTEVIILEVSFFQFYVNGPQFYDVVNYMKKHGFVAYDISGGSNRPLDNALSQIDMVFVKENGPFRKYHFWATQEQRKQIFKKRFLWEK